MAARILVKLTRNDGSGYTIHGDFTETQINELIDYVLLSEAEGHRYSLPVTFVPRLIAEPRLR